MRVSLVPFFYEKSEIKCCGRWTLMRFIIMERRKKMFDGARLAKFCTCFYRFDSILYGYKRQNIKRARYQFVVSLIHLSIPFFHFGSFFDVRTWILTNLIAIGSEHKTTFYDCQKKGKTCLKFVKYLSWNGKLQIISFVNKKF